jgi:hypothetical protein
VLQGGEVVAERVGGGPVDQDDVGGQAGVEFLADAGGDHPQGAGVGVPVQDRKATGLGLRWRVSRR